MDLTQIYLASPDWIKALLVVVPFLTFYGTTRLLVRRPSGLTVAPLSPPVTHAPSALRYFPLSGRSEETKTDFVDLPQAAEKPVRQGAAP